MEPDPCETCKSTNENPFGGCFTLSQWFGNTCANCLFTRRNASCNKTEPLEPLESLETIDLTGDDNDE